MRGFVLRKSHGVISALFYAGVVILWRAGRASLLESIGQTKAKEKKNHSNCKFHFSFLLEAGLKGELLSDSRSSARLPRGVRAIRRSQPRKIPSMCLRRRRRSAICCRNN